MIINSTYTYASLLNAMREAFENGVDFDRRAWWDRQILSLRHYHRNPIPEGGEDYPYDEDGGWLPGKEWLHKIEDGQEPENLKT